MAISKLEVGVVPLGEGGDSLRSAAAKINENFSNEAHAASKLVGTGASQIPLAKDIKTLAWHSKYFGASYNTDLSNQTDGGIYRNHETNKSQNPDTRSTGSVTLVINAGNGRVKQISYPDGSGNIWQRDIVGGVVGGWTTLATHSNHYSRTTASGANVVVDSTGAFMRSTSSERYKDILAPLELDEAKYAQAMSLRPIVYRSTADADNPAYHYYSFSAEELGAYDPAFTLWRDTETVTDEDGNVTEQPLEERQAEGININALLAMSHAIAIKQGELIKDLQKQVDVLSSKLED